MIHGRAHHRRGLLGGTRRTVTVPGDSRASLPARLSLVLVILKPPTRRCAEGGRPRSVPAGWPDGEGDLLFRRHHLGKQVIVCPPPVLRVIFPPANQRI